MVYRMVLMAATLGLMSPTLPEGGKKGETRETPEVGDLSGYYTCKGQEAQGKNYSGIAMLIKKNDVYVVQWMVGGGSTFSGLGIRQGENFAVSWAIPGDRGVVRGVNLYKVEPGPRLVGRWASLPGPGIMQSETLTFLKKLDLEE